MGNKIVFYLGLFCYLFSSACVQQDKTAVQASKIPTKQNYFLTTQGDSIPTGVSIPIKGRLINADSFTAPTTIPFTFKPRIAPAKANVHTVGQPKIVPVPKKLTVKTINRKG